MFTTFVGAPHQACHENQARPSSATFPLQSPRTKRKQVTRACDWCRVHRIKCDSRHPCGNCQERGGQCTNEVTSEVRTLPHAIREIERLRQRIKQLEEQLEERQSDEPEITTDHVVSIPDHYAASAKSASPGLSAESTLNPLQEDDSHRKYGEGIQMSTAQSQEAQWYGPSSIFYFIGRMSAFLDSALQQSHSDRHMQPNSASKAFASPISPRKENNEDPLMLSRAPISGDSMTGTQEDYFLGLFWQSYHCTYQIVDEVQFREHYKSLWVTSGLTRKPSPLVDIILAICMQYGVAFIPRNDANSLSKADVNSDDATIAGRWFYRRCQTLLTSELESPTLTTLQCHIFSVIYLCNASYTNMAHSTLAVAVRTAHILGLHLEPPDTLPRSQRELRKRLWWTLFAVESKTCMKLGRPWSADISQALCSLPADDHEVAMLSGSTFTSFGDNITFLTYNLQNTKLVLAVRAIYLAFHDKCGEVLAKNKGKDLYNDPQSLESCAEFLLLRMKTLRDWLQNVPATMKTKRKDGGESFSIDRSTLEIELFAPLWLQRQQLLLELLYHNLSMNLLRPFICFYLPVSSTPTPTAECNAISCINHAIALTQIMHQALMKTDILSGWHEAFQWQWNATLTMIGFILAYPAMPCTATARKSIDRSIEVFEKFGDNFAVAASAVNVTRDLVAKADLLMDRFWNCVTVTPSFSSNGSEGSFSTSTMQSFNGTNCNANNIANALTMSSSLEREPLPLGQNPMADPIV